MSERDNRAGHLVATGFEEEVRSYHMDDRFVDRRCVFQSLQ